MEDKTPRFRFFAISIDVFCILYMYDEDQEISIFFLLTNIAFGPLMVAHNFFLFFWGSTLIIPSSACYCLGLRSAITSYS